MGKLYLLRTFFNLAVFKIKWKKYYSAGRATGHAHCVLNNWGYKHTLRMSYLLLYHRSNVCTNAPQCHAMHNLPVCCICCWKRIAGFLGLGTFSRSSQVFTSCHIFSKDVLLATRVLRSPKLPPTAQCHCHEPCDFYWLFPCSASPSCLKGQSHILWLYFGSVEDQWEENVCSLPTVIWAGIAQSV